MQSTCDVGCKSELMDGWLLQKPGVIRTAAAPVKGPGGRGSSAALMDHHAQPMQRSISAPAPASATEYDEETTSPSTEMADDSLSSTNESLTSPPHHLHPPPPPNHPLRNPPTSLPVQSTFDRPHHLKHPLQHQISAPVTGSNVPSSRRYSRSISKKELIKNYIKKETAVFFGVHEPTEENERARWLDRRKRLACRTYGQLKNEYQIPSGCSTLQKPDVLPLTSQRKDKTDEGTDERDAVESRSIESTLKRKPSVARMTFDGVAYVVSTLGRHRRRPSSSSRQWSRSYAPSSVPPTPSSPLDDEVFFDRTSFTQEDFHSRSLGTATVTFSGDPSYDPSGVGSFDQVDSSSRVQPRFTATSHRIGKEKYYTWRRPSQRLEDDHEVPQIGLSRIWSRFLDRIFDNSDRRQYGMGVVGRVFGRSIKRSVVNREPVKEQLEDLEDHRPFFTYWVTTVQILILALSIFAYGLGPVGFDLTQRSGLVLVTSLSLQQVEYSEPSNFWIGPRAADLIHMGAKFAPCMRKDMKIIKEIEKMRNRERDTACCIRNDDSGCVQASQAECSKAISTWKKWSTDDIGPNGRVSGSVCGLDPKFCEAPASVAPHEWPDDITKWPICRKMSSRFSVQTMSPGHHGIKKDKMAAAEHMVCEVIGHPCCIGIHGTCRITTKEYCDFVRGYFHEDASLCSQVSCLDDVCGMIPFYVPEAPDQFYRLWTSLFIHAGVLHLAITVIIQYFFMRDLEKLTGSLRIAFIYIGSGVAGNLASAIFVPYRAEVGPAGAQFGLLACLVVEVLNCWPMLKHPFQALMKLLAVTFSLFLFGLLPWVDNFAHLFGFGFGFLLSYALLPFVSFGPYDRHRKIFFIWVCLLSSLCFFVLLVLLFYLIPFYDCEVCHYLNCIPLTRDFCATQNINFKREEYVV
ncbi:hypothetical protein V9T40_011350 [Parthenolecanium corni]|uniref:Peptidase S54 rhomboid domain-containing protein n=1 Tax=Parthenolecanium corni TaxID=536013 RepID=A0AAN9T6R4_9HEMI